MSANEPDCGKCQACYLHYPPIENPFVAVFILCSECGNKRCPHATDHRLPCTGSNEPNQPGSSYQQRYFFDE